MTVFVSSGCLGHGRKITEVVPRLLEAGLDAIEISPSHVCEEGVLEYLEGRRARFGVHVFCPPPSEPLMFNLSSPDPSVRARSIDAATEAVISCRRLGCDLYTMHGGFLVDLKTDLSFGDSRLEHDRGLDLFFEALEGIRRVAADNGVAVAVENNFCPPGSGGTALFCDESDFQAMYRQSGFGDVGVLLDLGHLRLASGALGFDAGDFVDNLRDRILLLHVSGNDGLSDEHRPFDERDWCVEMIQRHRLGGIDMVAEVFSGGIPEMMLCRDILLGLSGGV